MQLSSDIFDEFKIISKKDIRPFFEKTARFFTEGYYNDLSNYYSGKTSQITSIPFQLLDELQAEVSELYQIFSSLEYRLTNFKWWLLIEQIEEIDNRLKTARNINKWSRSTAQFVGYSAQQEINYTLKQNDTLEKVASNILASVNAEDDWVGIAVKNILTEDEYDVEGGVSIRAAIRSNSINSFTINSVVDVINESTINGKDLLKAITIETTDDGYSDLKTVVDLDCAIQSAEILVQLKKGDNPDFPQDGLQGELVIGGTRASFNFPVITRQLKDTFATDDSLKNFNITNVSIEQDNMQLDYTVETRLGEILGNDKSLI